MRLSIKDTRTGYRRRWTDLVNLNQRRFNEICEIIDRCDELDSKTLAELQGIINRKLSAEQISS
jgi:hypothetical protein